MQMLDSFLIYSLDLSYKEQENCHLFHSAYPCPLKTNKSDSGLGRAVGQTDQGGLGELHFVQLNP